MQSCIVIRIISWPLYRDTHRILILLVRHSPNIHRCNNTFYEVASHSSSDTKTKGVLILVRRTLNITILYKGCDKDSRITRIKTIVENRNIVLLSVYAPCTPVPTFFSVLSTYLLKCSDFEIVLGADTNSVMSHILDRSAPKETLSSFLF